MEEQGLAAQQGAPAPEDQMMQQVLMLLQQGATPEDLIAQGVPVEIIEIAMRTLQEQANEPIQDSGLAAKRVING